MKHLRVWFYRLSGLFAHRRRETELSAELECHLQLHIDDNLRAGMPPAEARRQAFLRLGGVEPVKEAYRDRSSVPVLEHAWQDLNFALRQLAKNPGFACTAILMLALGLSASVAIFAFVDAALVKPLPYRNPSRLVAVDEKTPLFPLNNLSYLDYLDWKKLNEVLVSMDVYNSTGYLLTTPAGAEPVRAARISDGFFRTLGVAPILGRDFHPGEDLPGVPKTVMLTYGAWQKRFAGAENVVGQTLALSGVPYTIVGVLPQRFGFAPVGGVELWTTLQPSSGCEMRRSCHDLDGIGRLKDGVSAAQALSEMKRIAGQLERQYPDSNRGQGANILPLTELIVGNVQPILLMLLCGASLLLLIACVNVASLLLVRSETRKREMAVRSSLGASRGRLIRQFMTEGLVLVGAGSVLGLACAHWTMRLLLNLMPADKLAFVPFLEDAGLNLHVLLFAGFVSLAAAVLFCAMPSLRMPLTELRGDMAEGSRGSAGVTWRHLGSKLVVVELATAMVLLVAAGLLGKSFYRLVIVGLNFEPAHLATVTIAAPDSAFKEDAKSIALARNLLTKISNLPGVESAGLSSTPPANFNGNTDWIRIVGRAYNGEHNEVNERDVSAGYFKTLHAKLLRGRYFTDAEDEAKPGVVIINQTLATKYFPGQDPIGQKIGNTSLEPKSMRQVIGVVDDIREGALDADIWPAEYHPFNQDPSTFFFVAVRTKQAEQSLLNRLVQSVHEVDSRLGIVDEFTMNDRIGNSPAAYLHRSSAWLVGGFAAVALLLGVVGLYGVIAYSVSQRTREIGVRMALGAERAMVYSLILREAGSLTLSGILAGLVLAIGAASLMRNLLFGVQSWDLSTLATVAALLAVSALLASYLPARRAASVNPVDALRAE